MIPGECINIHGEFGVIFDKGEQVGHLLDGITLLLRVLATDKELGCHPENEVGFLRIPEGLHSLEIAVGILLLSILSLRDFLDGDNQALFHGHTPSLHDGTYACPKGFPVFGRVAVRKETDPVCCLVYQRKLLCRPVGAKVATAFPTPIS